MTLFRTYRFLLDAKLVRRAVMALGILLGSACGDSAGPRLEGINFVSGDGVRDTISSTLPQNLVVLILDSTGAPLADETVRFEGLRAVDFRRSVLISLPGANDFSVPLLLARTNVDGQASIQVKFGTTAGIGVISVAVPTLGYLRAANYNIDPGRAVTIGAVPVDTVVAPNESFQFTAQALDRWSNPRSDPVSFATNDPTVIISKDGVASSSAVGQHWVQLKSGSVEDSVPFRVAVSARAIREP